MAHLLTSNRRNRKITCRQFRIHSTVSLAIIHRVKDRKSFKLVLLKYLYVRICNFKVRYLLGVLNVNGCAPAAKFSSKQTRKSFNIKIEQNQCFVYEDLTVVIVIVSMSCIKYFQIFRATRRFVLNYKWSTASRVFFGKH